MSLATAKIPSDPAELRAFAASLQNELYAKTLHVEKLKAQLALLKRARYGRSSEKIEGEIEQLELLIGDLEEGGAESNERRHTATPSSARRERSSPVRRPLPGHLLRDRVEHEAACACPSCGGTVLTTIGTDEREVLEYVPSHFKVIVHVRPKVSCRACETIMQPPMPSLPIERGLPGPGLLAHVPVLDPGRGKTRTGRLWVAVRDERPWGSCVPPAAFYLYAPDRKAERAEALLGECRGYLHADAYAGFNSLYKPVSGKARLTEVACWAHARRQIFEVHADTASPAAWLLLQKIGELFAIEADISGRPPEERLAVRAARSAPMLAALRAEFEAARSKVSDKSSFAKALRYALTRWDALERYTTDGRLDICNNAAERAIRPLALGRKNWLFAGSDSGGERAAKMYTLIETAKLNGLDPEAYLRAVIARIADHPIRRIDEMLPWNIAL